MSNNERRGLIRIINEIYQICHKINLYRLIGMEAATRQQKKLKYKQRRKHHKQMKSVGYASLAIYQNPQDKLTSSVERMKMSTQLTRLSRNFVQKYATHFKTDQLGGTPLGRGANAQMHPASKIRDIVYAQKVFRDLHTLLIHKMTRLDELTQTYVTDGPLKALKFQTTHHDFLFTSLLSSQYPQQNEKQFLRKVVIYSNMVAKLLNKCNIEMMRLTATPEMFKKLKKRKQKKIKSNDEEQKTQIPTERSQAQQEPTPSLTPLLSPHKQDTIEEAEREHANSVEQNPFLESVEDDEVNYETFDEQVTGDHIMASNIGKARVTEKDQETDQDQYNVLDDVVHTLTKNSKNTKSQATLLTSSALTGNKNIQFLVLSLGLLEARSFRKFLERMSLLQYFNIRMQPLQKIFTFTFLPDLDNLAQSKKIIRFFKNFQIFEKQLEFSPENFQIVESDPKLRQILNDSTNVEHAFNFPFVQVIGYNLHEVKAVTNQIDFYINRYKLFREKYRLTRGQALMLYSFEHAGKLRYKQLFPQEFQITQVVETEGKDSKPAYHFLFSSTRHDKPQVVRKIKTIVENLRTTSFNISESICYLLQLPHSTFPQFNYLNAQEVKNNSAAVIERARTSSNEDLFVPQFNNQNDKDQGKKEEEDPKSKKIQNNLKLNIEGNEVCVHKLILVSPGSTQLKRMEAAIREFIDQVQLEKKFFQIEGKKTGESPQKKKGTMTWEQISLIIGTPEHKSDFLVNFEKQYSVLIFLLEKESFKGLMLYGTTQYQKLAFLELGSLFGMQRMGRKSIQVAPMVQPLIDEVSLNSLNANLKSDFKRVEAFLYTSRISNKTFGVVFAEKKAAQSAAQRMEDLITQFKDALQFQQSGPEYYVLKDKLPQIKLAHNLRFTFQFNESGEDKKIFLPQYKQMVQWKESEHGDSSYKRCDMDKSQLLEQHYHNKSEYFLNNRSNFSLLNLKENIWNQFQGNKRLTIIRSKQKVLDKDKKIEVTLPPKCLIIRGYEKEILQVKKVLDLELHQLRMKSRVFPINTIFNPQVASEIERKYQVQIRPYRSGRKIKITGIFRENAYHAYSQQVADQFQKYIFLSFLNKISLNQLDPNSLDYRREATRFYETKGQRVAVIVKIEKIQNQQTIKNYETEKRIFQQRFEKFGEKHLFCKNQKYQDRENKYSRNSEYFFDNLKSDEQGNFTLVVAKVLTGRSYPSNSEEQTEWIVPPRMSSSDSNAQASVRQSTSSIAELMNKRHGNELQKILQEKQQKVYVPLEDEEPSDHGVDQEDDDEDGFEFYDSVEIDSAKGKVYVVFNKYYVCPTYVVTFNFGATELGGEED